MRQTPRLLAALVRAALVPLALGVPAFALLFAQTEPAPVGISQDEITPALIEAGAALFNEGACAKCHLEHGQGGERAPALDDDEWLHSDGTFDGIRRTIWTGVGRDALRDADRPFPMNPGGGLPDRTAETLDAVAAYVRSLGQE